MAREANNRPLIIWLLAGCVLMFLMVIIGGITRLTHSGLSIVEWNLIMGALPPFNERDWVLLFDQYRQFPEYRELHSHFSLSDFKAIFWWEYLHRLLGRVIGLVFVIPFLWFLARRRISRAFAGKCLILFLLGGFQGFLGWFMVKSGLADVPRVSHYRLAAHLITAFATCGLTFWYALQLMYPTASPAPSGIRLLLRVFLSLTAFQIIYGAFVAGLRAGKVFTTFPKMGQEWIPEAVTAMDPWVMNFLEGQAGVQFVHRYAAYAVLFLAFFVWHKGRSRPLISVQRFSLHGVLGCTLLQFLLGVITLLTSVPVAMGVIHQSGAFALWIAALFALFHFRKP